MNWVSNKVLTDIRNELFGKMLSHSMDFFNKMRSGVLMSRITNDTRMHADRAFQREQRRLQATYHHHQRHGRAALHGLEVYPRDHDPFPSCLIPLRMFGKRARKAVPGEQEELGQMVGDHAGNLRRHPGGQILWTRGTSGENPSNAAIASSSPMPCGCVRSMQAIGPLVEIIAAIGVGLALFYVYVENLPAAKFIALITGIFILYDPIKTLSRIHVTFAALGRRQRLKFSGSSIPLRLSWIAPDAIVLPTLAWLDRIR